MKTWTKENFRFVDLFCGGGGSITGEIAALKKAGVKYEGRGFNHWNLAIETIKANHPEIIPDFERACADIAEISGRPQSVFADDPTRLDLLWASPSCTHHSNAAGGTPRSEIKATLLRKWKIHDELTDTMAKIIRDYGLSAEAIRAGLTRSMGCERKEERGNHYVAINRDCVEETAEMPDNSVDLIHTSIPFSNHYEYSPSYNDFGHNLDNDRFFAQMDYLTPHLLRVLKPGRVAAVHVKDRILFGAVTGTGMPTVDPFSDETVAHFRKHGFQFFGRITIETDVVRENNQTYRLGWTECCKDGSKMGVGCPEYLLLFRKLPTDHTKGYADLPVMHTKEEYSRGRWQIDARAKWNSSGNRLLTDEELANFDLEQANDTFSYRAADTIYDYAGHVEVAEAMEKRGRLPATFETFRVPARTPWVWDDVVRMRTLNGEQSRRNLEKHICPLQFDIVERVIERWSNPGEVVYDPFGGIMTVPYCAVKMDRFGIGVELNTSYWHDGCRYLEAAEAQKDAPTLFDAVAAGD